MNLIFLSRHVHFAIGVLALCVVLVGSITTSPFPDNTLPVFNDKLIHAVAYGGLSLWFAQLLVPKRYPHLAIGLFCYGATIEWLQSLLSHRSASLLDMLANFTGIVIALGICLLVTKISAE